MKFHDAQNRSDGSRTLALDSNRGHRGYWIHGVFIPMDVAAWIGTAIAGWEAIELADGSEKKLPSVYCDVELLDVRTQVRAFITDVFDPLIGTELLEGCRLIVDFDTGSVQLKR